MEKIKTAGRWKHSAIIKIMLGLMLCAGVAMLIQILFANIQYRCINLSQDAVGFIKGIFTVAGVVSVYIVFFRIIERRSIVEFKFEGVWKQLFYGILIGAGLQALTILIIYLNDGYEIVSVNPVDYILQGMMMGFTSAIVEETLIRGIIYRVSEEKLGSYGALALSALLFGAMHLGNPNSSLVNSVGLAIQAGLLLGAAFIYTRRLWLPIAIHFAWNFTQSGIFGARVSGNELSKSLITAEFTGNKWITGGDFGPEGSLQATLLCLVVAVVFMVLSHKKNRIIKPIWLRKGSSPKVVD
ncbi:MAG: type II CAAX endopeptidase family protein [Sediminibacterium sp.]|nr:type II CAAX endopeptidase family protein [Sediminibacterium sp.]